MIRNLLSLLVVISYASPALANGGADDPVAPVLLGLVVLFAGAKIGAYLMNRVGQPAVLGELLMGVVLGNATLVGFSGFNYISHGQVFEVLAGIGVILLLFEVGLESSLRDMLRVGFVALAVAIVGVVLPFVLGYAVSCLLMPDKSVYIHAFIGATLCATSVGITARVFKDLGRVHSPEAKIILGAAVIDDVLGLIILAVVSGTIVAAQRGGEGIALTEVGWITAKAVGFLAIALVVGAQFAPRLFRWGARLRIEGMLLTLSLLVCFLLSYVANLVGLAPIVGAFAAGLVIDGAGFSKYFSDGEHSLEDLIFPVSKFFVPLFFVHMGMQVRLELFASGHVLLLGFLLSVAAIVGKQACGWAVFGQQGISRLVVGIGMIPRGEVGLIFAAIGSGLVLNGEPVVSEALYAAIVVMVMVTTIITPPGLKWSLTRAP